MDGLAGSGNIEAAAAELRIGRISSVKAAVRRLSAAGHLASGWDEVVGAAKVRESQGRVDQEAEKKAEKERLAAERVVKRAANEAEASRKREEARISAQRVQQELAAH